MRKRSIMRQIIATVSTVVLAVGMVPSYALPVVYADQTTTTGTASEDKYADFPVMTEFSASSQAYEVKEGADKLVLNVKANASEGRTIKKISVDFRNERNRFDYESRIHNVVEFEEVPSDGIYKVELPVTGYNAPGNYRVVGIDITDSKGYTTIYVGHVTGPATYNPDVTRSVHMDEPQRSYMISVINPTGDNNPPILESVLYNGKEQLEITDVTQTVDVAIGVKDDDSDSNAFVSGVKETRLMWNLSSGLSMTDFQLEEDGKYHSTLSFNQGIESQKLQLNEIELVDNAGNMSSYSRYKTEGDYVIGRIFPEKIYDSYINITNTNEDKEMPVLKDYKLKGGQDKYVKSKLQDRNNPINMLVAAEDINSGLKEIGVNITNPDLEEPDNYIIHGSIHFTDSQNYLTETIDGVVYYVVPLRYYDNMDDFPVGEYVIRTIHITDQVWNTVCYENKDIINNEDAVPLEKIISFQVVDDSEDTTGPVLDSVNIETQTQIIEDENIGTRLSIMYDTVITDDLAGYSMKSIRVWLKDSNGNVRGSYGSKTYNGKSDESYTSVISLEPYWLLDGTWRISKVAISDIVGNETTYYNAKDYPNETNKINFSDSNPDGEFTLTNPETDDKTGPVLKSLDLDEETSIVTYESDGSTRVAINYTSNVTDDGVGYRSGYDKIYLKKSFDGTGSGSCSSRRIGNNGDSYDSQIGLRPYSFSDGIWRVSRIVVSDKVGNETTYYNAVDYPDEANKINFTDSNPRGEFTLTNPETDDKTGPVLKSLDLDKETSIVTYGNDGSITLAIDYTSIITDDEVGYKSGADKIYLKNSDGKESGYWGSRGMGNNGDSYNSQIRIAPYKLSNGVWRISKIIVSDKVGNETTYYNAVDYPDEANKINFSDSNPRGEVTINNPEDNQGPVLNSFDLDKATNIMVNDAGETKVAFNYRLDVVDDKSGYGYSNEIYITDSNGKECGYLGSWKLGEPDGSVYSSQSRLTPYGYSNGTWRVSRIVVKDRSGNRTEYQNPIDYPDTTNPIKFTESNPRGEFVLTNPEDKAAPVLEKFSIISSTDITVDKDDEAKNFITYKMKASDDVSGIITLRVRITYKDSSGRLIGGGSSSFRYVNNKDDENYGYYVGKLPVYYDTFALQSGEYSIANIQVIDRAGNTSYYYTGESEELNEIAGKKITVSYGDDKVAPVLNKFEITKTDDNNVSKVTVGLGSADVNIPVVVNATDADSKMYKIEYYLRRQSTNGIWGTYSFGSKMLKYDNVDYSTGIYVSSKMVTDTYMIDRMILKDNAGNEKVYYNNKISDYKDKTDVLPEKACTWKLVVKNTDTTNPVLNDFYFGEEASYETKINTSDSEGSIKWTANVTDDNFYTVRFSL
ncbi:MAG: hypothetical protein SO361_06065, partial [Lachnospira sp.]|nr:hypothetical protein [Lachnospira sp.]